MLRRLVVTTGLLVMALGCGSPPDPFAPPPDVAAPPADAQRTPSGIASKMLRVGVGAVKPTPRSTVKVNYTLWTTDGKFWESSLKASPGRPAEPVTFSLDGVIPGWTEGLQLMVAGEKRRFWIPGNLAYGDTGPPDEPRGMLVFDIELLEIR
jgi:peptidylprolyl isomerase